MTSTNPTPSCPRSEALSAMTNRELAVRIAAEGAVLLENNGILPLAPNPKLALFGINQSGTFYAGGGGSGGSEATDILSTADAFAQAQNDGKLTCYAPLVEYYDGLSEEKIPGCTLMEGAAAFTDTALVFFGRYSTEGIDRKTEEYYLSSEEVGLLRAVCEKFRHVIVILNLCAVTDLSCFANYGIDALMISWMPGQYGAAALPSLLLGEISPSGKLVDTFADRFEAYPAAASFGDKHVDYAEDIYIGYRYFETIPGAAEHVLYPFGYGLSYTSFALHDITVCANPVDNTVTVSVRVENIGAASGKEVVQVYFSHPEHTILGYPAKELAAYAKTDTLAPGQSQTLTLCFSISDMAGYDDLGKISRSAYILEKGAYPIHVGTSVRDTVQATQIVIEQTTIVSKRTECGTKVLQLPRRLLADGSYEDLPRRHPTEVTNEKTMCISASNTSTLPCGSYLKAEGNDLLGIQNGALHNTHLLGRLTYSIDVERDGDYEVLLSAAQESSTGADCLHVFVDGLRQEDFRLDIEQASGGWELYRYASCGMLHLTSGIHELVVEIRNGAVGNMKSFRISPCSYEEERFDTSGLMDAPIVCADGETVLDATKYVSTSCPTLSINPSGYLQGMHGDGCVTYEVYAEVAADYRISLKVACGNAGGRGVLPILVNRVMSLYFCLDTTGGTGGWDQFTESDCGFITLKAGKNTISFNCTSGVNLMSMTLTRLSGAPSAVLEDIEPVPEDRIIPFSEVFADHTKLDAFLEQITTTDMVTLVCGNLYGSTFGYLPRYGIPMGTVSDGPAGLRAGTYWPVSVTQACTWNTVLLEEMGLRVGQEAYERSNAIWLAPAMNIHRHPLCGRNFEYFSEDPYVAGSSAAALVNGVQAQGVAITIKHMAANNCETYRDISDSRMSERALRQIYLEGFRIALQKCNAWCIMTSYNRINGCEVAESYDILTTIVREEWGYDGLIMSDWWNNSSEVLELLAGNNLKMPEGNPVEMIQALQSGKLNREVLKMSARRVLELMLHIDRFKEQYDLSFKHRCASEPLRPVGRERFTK